MADAGEVYCRRRRRRPPLLLFLQQRMAKPSRTAIRGLYADVIAEAAS